MNISPKAQNLSWIAFLLSYSIFKYMADIKQEFQLAYLINVGILIMLTAVLPYYLTRLGMHFSKGALRAFIALTQPLVLCALGLAAFFYLYVKPYVPDMSVFAVLPRSIFPGVMMILILVPLWLDGEAKESAKDDIT